MWLCHPISLLSIVVAIASALPQPSDDAVQDRPSAVVGRKITCPAMFQVVGDQCLYFGIFMKTDQKGSAQICSSIAPDAGLVAIKTATQMKYIVSYINKTGYGSLGFWIDGTVNGSGIWNFESGEPLPMGMPFWAASEEIKYPSPVDPILKCVAITHDWGFYIENVDCTGPLSPICEAPPVAVDLDGDHTDIDEGAKIDSVDIACPPFYVNLEGTPICTAFVIWASVSWSDARQICLGLQGDIFTANDIAWYKSISDYLHEEGIDTFSFWIGGHKDVNGTWHWPDGVPVPKGAPFWGLSDTPPFILEPDGTDEDCIAMTSEGEYYLRDKPCSDQYSPICVTMPLDPNE